MYVIGEVNTLCGADSFCWGYMSVERISFALILFHLLFFVLLLGVTKPENPRSFIQNKCVHQG